MSLYITVDPGSCHMGRLDYAKKLIEEAKNCDADAIKFQLFKNSPGNIPLPYEWWPQLVEYAKVVGIDIYASVWDREGAEYLQNTGCTQIKIAYSQILNTTKFTEGFKFEKIFVSGDVMSDFPDIKNLIRLYCIPEYPVKYLIDFDGIFEKGFSGFSDHTLGSSAACEATKLGAQYLEKHFTLNLHDINCPDNKFAFSPNEMRKYISYNRSLNNAFQRTRN